MKLYFRDEISENITRELSLFFSKILRSNFTQGYVDFIRRFKIVLISVAVILMIWGTVVFNFIESSRRDEREISHINNNYSVVFEENFLRFISEIDKVLFYLRRGIADIKLGSDYNTIVQTSDLQNEAVAQVSIIGADGFMLASSAAQKSAKPLNLSDRPHFRAHLGTSEDKLFIGAPLVGRVSGIWSLQFSRMFRKDDGSFGGVVVASLKPEHLINFYGRVEFQYPTSISIIGDDGIVRTSGGSLKAYALGEDVSKSQVFKQIALGKNTNLEEGSSKAAHLITTLRKIQGTHFWLAISTQKDAIYANTRHDSLNDVALALSLTLIVLAFTRKVYKSEILAHQNLHQLKLTLQNMTQGILLVMPNRSVPIINPKFCEMFDFPESVVSKSPDLGQLIDYKTSTGDEVIARILDWKPSPATTIAANAALPNRFDICEHALPNGVVMEQRVVYLPDGGLVHTFTDTTLRSKAESNVARLASEDSLTELLNRRGFYRALEEVQLQPRKKPGRSKHAYQNLAVFFLDLDKFKAINDNFGHRIGDLLLIEVSRRLRDGIRSCDILARFGGDEFAIILRDFKDLTYLQTIARRLNEAIKQSCYLDGQLVNISTSIGIAVQTSSLETVDHLLAKADAALYSVKTENRGGIKFYHPSMSLEFSERRKLELDLRNALASNELKLHYQPLLNLVSGAIVGFEALCRWQHPTIGAISPLQFIAVAEESDLIVELTRWALLEACREAARWPETVYIAVNISPVCFNDPRMVEYVAATLGKTGLTAHRLELEITEQTYAKDAQSTLATLLQFKQMGVRVVLDDFGTGYSSLSYLSTLPLDKIKIDRSFISGLEFRDAHKATIVQAVISIARAFSMTVTAEGVELEGQREFLIALGCDEAQGYLFSRPVSAEKVPGLLGMTNSRAA